MWVAQRRNRVPGIGVTPLLAVVCPLLLVLSSACTSRSFSDQPGSDIAESTGSRAPNVLTIGIHSEPTNLVDYIRVDAGTGGGISQIFFIPNNYLAVQNDRGEFAPQLAVELPSVQQGTWRVNADGSMETTWKLHPNVQWHDGTPFTASDIVFAYTVYRDREVPTGFAVLVRDVTSVTAPDPLTVVVQYSTTRNDADRGVGLTPLPQHLLEGIYQSDKANFTHSSRFSTDHVGLGSHRLVRWEAGSHLEFAAFADYFRGRPPLDSVIVRFIPDPNTEAAAILSGALDVLLPIALNVDAAAAVEERWKGTGNTVLFFPGDRTEMIYMQQRPELARPANGFTSVLVRQAMYHAIDRAALAEAITLGKSPPAESWFNAADPLLSQVRDAIPLYPYDRVRAQQLLAQAGWVRGADGILIHQPSGERFEVELHASAGSDTERKLTIIADEWKSVGAQVSIYIVPPQLAQDSAARARLPGAGAISFAGEAIYGDMLLSTGRRNQYGGYSNPRYDALVNRLFATLVPAERVPILRDMLQVGMGEVAIMPLYYRIDSTLFVRGVKGVSGHPNTQATWNIFEWDKEP